MKVTVLKMLPAPVPELHCSDSCIDLFPMKMMVCSVFAAALLPEPPLIEPRESICFTNKRLFFAIRLWAGQADHCTQRVKKVKKGPWLKQEPRDQESVQY